MLLEYNTVSNIFIFVEYNNKQRGYYFALLIVIIIAIAIICNQMEQEIFKCAVRRKKRGEGLFSFIGWKLCGKL